MLALPGRECGLCPRLVDFRHAHRALSPDWHNAPVPPFGDLSARLLVVGLAPGLRGANRSGRPFTGDYAGDLLYPTLVRYGLAHGVFGREADDGLRLSGARITNAVRCVPPENKPTPLEQKTCRPFLVKEIAAMPALRVILALGHIAHTAVLATLGEKASQRPFAHAALHRLESGIIIVNSYHCSRYNVNTGRLTEAMFHAVFEGFMPLIG